MAAYVDATEAYFYAKVPYNRTNPINLQTLIPRLEKALDDKLGANGVVQRIEIVKK